MSDGIAKGGAVSASAADDGQLKNPARVELIATSNDMRKTEVVDLKPEYINAATVYCAGPNCPGHKDVDRLRSHGTSPCAGCGGIFMERCGGRPICAETRPFLCDTCVKRE